MDTVERSRWIDAVYACVVEGVPDPDGIYFFRVWFEDLLSSVHPEDANLGFRS